MKKKICMALFALFCLGGSLLVGGCAAPQSSQKSYLSPLVGGPGGPYDVQGSRENFWPHPMVLP